MEQEDSSREIELPQEDGEIEPSAERAVERCRLIYDSIGPEVGCVFVEANMVLTLADCRGQTETPIWNPDETDKAQVEKLKGLQIDGIKVRSYEGRHKIFGPDISLNLESLDGYEIATRSCAIPGVAPFFSKEGWDGLAKWRLETIRGIKFAIANGLLPGYAGSGDIYAGVIKGYPDQAILDAIAYCEKLRGMKKEAKTSNTPLAKYYGGAQPFYQYLPESSDNLLIKQHEAAWQRILEEFYASEWHRQVAVTLHLSRRAKEIMRKIIGGNLKNVLLKSNIWKRGSPNVQAVLS